MHSLLTCFGFGTKVLVNSTGVADACDGGHEANFRASGRENFGFGGTTMLGAPGRLGTTFLENGARTEEEEIKSERTNVAEDGEDIHNGVRLLITSASNGEQSERSDGSGGAIDPMVKLEFALTDIKPSVANVSTSQKRGSNSSECLRYGQLSFGKTSSISETDIASTSGLLANNNGKNKSKHINAISSKETTVSLGKSKSPLRSRFSMFHFHHNKSDKQSGSNRAIHQVVSVVIEPATSNGSEDSSIKSIHNGNSINKKEKTKRSLLALRDTSTQDEDDQLEFTSIL